MRLPPGYWEKKGIRKLDADFSDFFSTLDHEWLVKFLEHRIADRRVLRLIQKWLGAGVIEDGTWTACEEGAPQGSAVTAPTQSRTSSLSARFRGRRGGVGREAWYSSG